MSSVWKVFCFTEDQWVETISSTEPTECPNDSGHSIGAVWEVEKLSIFCNDTVNRTSYSNSYATMNHINWPGSTAMGRIALVNILSEKDDQTTSFDVRLVDTTNHVILAEHTGMTNNEECACPLTMLAESSADHAILETHLRCTGAVDNTNGAKLYSVSIFTRTT